MRKVIRDMHHYLFSQQLKIMVLSKKANTRIEL